MYSGPNCWLLCYDNTLCNKKELMPGFFFFRYVLAIWPSWNFFLLSIAPKNPWFFQAPNAMRRSRKRRSMGWASKLWSATVACTLANPRVLQNWVDTLGVCFLSQMSFFLQTSSKQKPKLWLQMMSLWKPRKVSSIMGVIQQLPRFTRIYADLRTSQKYGSSFCSRRCMVNFLDDLSVISS